MQIPENIKFLSAYDIGQLIHKKKICPIDLVNFYYNEISSFKEHSPYTTISVIEISESKNRDRIEANIEDIKTSATTGMAARPVLYRTIIL